MFCDYSYFLFIGYFISNVMIHEGLYLKIFADGFLEFMLSLYIFNCR